MTESEAWNFAQEWVAAWNSHDLERILLHFGEDAELTSRLMKEMAGIHLARKIQG